MILLPLKYILVYLFVFYLNGFLGINKKAANGFHTKKVQLGILRGMVLFIVSEIMFFFKIF